MPSALKDWRVLLALVLLTSFSVKLFFVVNHDGMWGVDGGAYLLSRNFVLGDEPTQTDFRRPPFAPGWLLVPFTAALGDSAGLKAFAFVMSFAAFPAFWMLARQLLSRRQSIAALAIVAFDWQLAEMFTAGVLPMIAFGFLMWAMLAVWKLSSYGEPRIWGILLILCIPAIAYTNQTVAGITALILPVWTLSLGWRTTKLVALPAIIGLAFALTALPYYTQVAPGSGLLRYPGPLISFYSLQNFGWWLTPVLVLVGGFSIAYGRGIERNLGILILALAPICVLHSFDETVMNVLYRARYFVMYPTAICLVARMSAAVALRPQMRPAILGYVSLLSIMLFTGWIYTLHAETKLGRMTSGDSLEAIEYIQSQPGDGAILTNSYSYALYVAALTKREVGWMQVYDPPPAYKEQHWRVSCIAGWTPGCDVAGSVKALDADYLLVERMWASKRAEAIQANVAGLNGAYRLVDRVAIYKDDVLGYIWGAPPEQWEITERTPWLEKVWERGTVTVWRIKPL